MLQHVFDVDSEVFELTVALVKEDNETKYQKLVMYLFKKAEEGLLTENESYIAFNILTLAMQVIDDAYFKQRYFDLVVNNFTKLTSYQAKDINNRLILTWVTNAIEEKSDNLEVFKDAYEKKCIAYIFTMFSNIKKEQISKVKWETSYVQEKLQGREDSLLDDLPIYTEFRVLSNYTLFSGMKNTPFYVHVYQKYFNIFDKLERYNKTPINKIFEFLNVSSRSQRTTVKKGVSVYKSLALEIRMKLCEMLMK